MRDAFVGAIGTGQLDEIAARRPLLVHLHVQAGLPSTAIAVGPIGCLLALPSNSAAFEDRFSAHAIAIDTDVKHQAGFWHNVRVWALC